MVRKTLQWIAAILVLGGASGGGYAYWLYTQTNEWLRGYAEKAFLQRIPTAVISIGRARFDWSHRIHLYDVHLSAKGLDAPVARCVEIIVTVDGQELSDDQTIDVRSLRIIRPDVRLLRNAEGHWNWQKLHLARPEDPCPELSFEDLQVAVHMDQGSGQTRAVHIQQSSVRLIPSAHREFAIEAAAQLARFGRRQLSAGISRLRQGDLRRVRRKTRSGADVTELMGSFTRIFPDAAQRLAAFQNRIPAATVTTADLSDAEAQNDLTLGGQASINFEIVPDRRRSAELDYQAGAVLALTEIKHPLLPFALENLTGTVYVNKQRLVLRNVTVRNGPTQMVADGLINLPVPAPANRIDVKIQDLRPRSEARGASLGTREALLRDGPSRWPSRRGRGRRADRRREMGLRRLGPCLQTLHRVAREVPLSGNRYQRHGRAKGEHVLCSIFAAWRANGRPR